MIPPPKIKLQNLAIQQYNKKVYIHNLQFKFEKNNYFRYALLHCRHCVEF